ncbi:MAG: transcription antitermination factor NusB [Immundisolibacter sp.]|uniref:transcription antitermination factor NusB n=1 Tax=Immundisolibacter sp. TaxID=1934948 RepID=UPI0019BA2777|nr:transcription antitermination factor NusB [Immundisolibacter sp.]MBC7161017.1 transcription antitermination factor NusB [Immundisolibacter sp.]
MSRARSKARRGALQALYQWQLAGGDDSLASIESQFLAERELGDIDAEYFHELLTEVGRRHAEYDQRIAPLLDRPLEQLDPVEHAILWLGSYELEARWDIPFRVVIAEAMELTKQFGGDNAHRYVNAILDRLARELRAAERALPT